MLSTSHVTTDETVADIHRTACYRQEYGEGILRLSRWSGPMEMLPEDGAVTMEIFFKYPETSLAGLPEEIKLLILEHLQLHSLCNMSSTSRDFQRLSAVVIWELGVWRRHRAHGDIFQILANAPLLGVHFRATYAPEDLRERIATLNVPFFLTKLDWRDPTTRSDFLAFADEKSNVDNEDAIFLLLVTCMPNIGQLTFSIRHGRSCLGLFRNLMGRASGFLASPDRTMQVFMPFQHLTCVSIGFEFAASYLESEWAYLFIQLPKIRKFFALRKGERPECPGITGVESVYKQEPQLSKDRLGWCRAPQRPLTSPVKRITFLQCRIHSVFMRSILSLTRQLEWLDVQYESYQMTLAFPIEALTLYASSSLKELAIHTRLNHKQAYFCPKRNTEPPLILNGQQWISFRGFEKLERLRCPFKFLAPDTIAESPGWRLYAQLPKSICSLELDVEFEEYEGHPLRMVIDEDFRELPQLYELSIRLFPTMNLASRLLPTLSEPSKSFEAEVEAVATAHKLVRYLEDTTLGFVASKKFSLVIRAIDIRICTDN